MGQKKLKHFVHLLLGMSFGDEGKGKVVIDLLQGVLGTKYRACVRYNGGANAGHTIFMDGKKYVTHQIPSGILVPGVANLIAHGVKVNPTKLLSEMEDLKKLGVKINNDNLFVDPAAHVVLPTHVMMDILSEDRASTVGQEIGSTKQGMKQVAVSKVGRESVRLHDVLMGNGKLEKLVSDHIDFIQRNYRPLLQEEFDRIEKDLAALKDSVKILQHIATFVDSMIFIREMLEEGPILGEGAQGFGLDMDHGTYPFVTSSNSGSGAFIEGTGVPFQWLDLEHVFGVAKFWYETRVGQGPFPTDISPGVKGWYTKEEHPLAYAIQNAGEHEEGSEKGATTQRPRQVGYFDLPFLQYAVERSGVTHLILTKADRPREEDCKKLLVCTGYRSDGSLVGPDENLMLMFDSVEPEYVEVAFVPAARDVLFDDQPEPVRRHMRLIKRRLGEGVEVPFMSVGPKPGQIVYVDRAPSVGGTLMKNGAEDRIIVPSSEG